MVPVFTYSPPSPATSTHPYLEKVNTGTVTLIISSSESKSRPDNRRSRKALEESPGSIGQGAR